MQMSCCQKGLLFNQGRFFFFFFYCANKHIIQPQLSCEMDITSELSHQHPKIYLQAAVVQIQFFCEEVQLSLSVPAL